MVNFKKNLRLKCFDYSSDNYYFVTQNTDFNRRVLIAGLQKLVESEISNLEIRFEGIFVDTKIVMPTHVHILFKFSNTKTNLPHVMQALKSITTLKAKKLGFKFKRFWQPTYYERVVRTEQEYFATRNYILNNPSKIDILSEGL